MTGGAESERDQAKRHHQRTLFDGIADRYQQARPGYPADVADFIGATAAIGPGAAVLEVGCGTGQLTERLAYSSFRLTAIDPGPAMVAAARRRLADAGVRFEVTSFEELDAPEGSFDLVISGTAFHWIDPAVAFAKPARLLRPGGWLALADTHEHYDDPLGAALDDLWVSHGDTGGAWERRPSDPAVIAASGLFGPSARLDDRQRAVLPAAGVVALESTRAAFLTWPPETQRRFTADLRALLGPAAAAGLTRHTSVTMAQARRLQPQPC